MKRIVIFSLFVLVSSVVVPKMSWAKVKFADETIKEDIEQICDEYEVIQKLFARLSSSNLSYVIRYGKVRMQGLFDAEGLFQTDGETLYLTFRKMGWAEYSLPVLFAHEATHALQFESGKIGFSRNSSGKWDPINYDILDEAEAFQTMVLVATQYYDLIRKSNGIITDLGRFKREQKLYGFQKAVQWLCNIYPRLSVEVKNNPTLNIEVMNEMWAKRGRTFYCMPYQSTIDRS